MSSGDFITGVVVGTALSSSGDKSSSCNRSSGAELPSFSTVIVLFVAIGIGYFFNREIYDFLSNFSAFSWMKPDNIEDVSGLLFAQNSIFHYFIPIIFISVVATIVLTIIELISKK